MAFPNPRPATACLFDMDGLLLDTEIIYTQVTQQIVGRFGKVFDWSIKGNMIGRPAEDSARYLVEALDLPISAAEYMAERDSLLRKQFACCDSLAGAEALIRHLSQHQIPIAVATSSSRELFDIKTTNHQSWFSLFDTVVTGDDPLIKKGKPAPDIFLLAAQRLTVNPESALVFEDAPTGLHAGIDAGMQVICVPDANMDRSRYEGASRILNSLEQLDLSEFSLPAI